MQCNRNDVNPNVTFGFTLRENLCKLPFSLSGKLTMEKGKQQAFAAKIKEKIAEIKMYLADNDPVGNPVLPKKVIGRLSRVDAMEKQEMRLALVRQNKHELARLENALSLIESGKYGVCIGCGSDIPANRLEDVPDAQMCVPCLSELQGKKQDYLF